MPLYKCCSCHHEFEYIKDEDEKEPLCDWCNAPTYILQEKANLEKLFELGNRCATTDVARQFFYRYEDLKELAYNDMVISSMFNVYEHMTIKDWNRVITDALITIAKNNKSLMEQLIKNEMSRPRTILIKKDESIVGDNIVGDDIVGGKLW